MVAEVREQYESEWAAIGAVADLLGVGTAETVRKWVRQDQVDAGARAGVTQRGVRGVEAIATGERRAQACQRDSEGGVGFLRRRDRPAAALITRFITEHQGRREGGGLRWSVESICAGLCELGVKAAPSTYYEHRKRVPTRRQVRDEKLKPQIVRVHRENFGVYGARKVWLQLNREGHRVARCTIERLMRELHLRGVRRGRVKRTTIADPAAERPADLVHRRFAPTAPNHVWVADITYVSTWSGWVYVAFVIDAYARRIIGWRTGTTMTTSLVLDAIEHAIWTRERAGRDVKNVVHHTDRGSSIRRLPSPNVSPRPGSSPAWGRWDRASTMLSPKRSTASTRPN